MLDRLTKPLPLIPILRGITPAESQGVGEALLGQGFRILEVPLNSPEPFASIERLARLAGAGALVGAGTVLTAADVQRVQDAGGRLIVTPHADAAVIRAAKELGMVCMPGIATPTEAFAALAAGADGLKLFPAELLQPPVVKAMRAVLPRATRLYPVGGITPASMGEFVAAGADGFGIGSAIFRPGLTVAEVAERARLFVDAWLALSGEARV